MEAIEEQISLAFQGAPVRTFTTLLNREPISVVIFSSCVAFDWTRRTRQYLSTLALSRVPSTGRGGTDNILTRGQ